MRKTEPRPKITQLALEAVMRLFADEAIPLAGNIAFRVLFSIFPRVAAWAEAGMISLFTLLVWAPAIAAAPKTRLPWTAFFISWAIASAAWVVAQNITPKRTATEKP